ncbi:unnamed protein product [Effrenium voratum]|uniref:Uncharacterized protein n=1 Tax=Effrenium voratum TaxID=2562239 RepID=A0AA36IWC1_9DINO|nr:unnamed protein product [Effrenium voratum]CAJ1446600.1 unnamed protein product [Effrenium voratum]
MAIDFTENKGSGQYALKQQAKSSDLKVPLLELLSQQLRSELYFARFRNALSKISFLQNLLASDDVQTFKILHEIATNALRDMVVVRRRTSWMTHSGWQRCAYGLPGSTWVTWLPRITPAWQS